MVKAHGLFAWRRKLRILLSQGEAERLEDARKESGSPYRSLLILEAIREGLRDLDLTTAQRKRKIRVDTWAPAELMMKLKEAASADGLTQQSLMRHLLFRYLDKAYRRSRPSEATRPEQQTHMEVAVN